MKAMRGWALLGASLAAFGLAACGDDDDNPGGTGGADGGSDAKSDGRPDVSTTPDVRVDTNTPDNRDSATTPDATEGGTTEGGGGGDAGDAGSPVQRGEYLVKNLGACGDCHTPINFLTGQPDNTRFLAGLQGIFQVPGLGPDGGEGIIGSRNLTPDMATGLGAWTDAQIKKALLDGIDKDGNALFPIMPYYVLHNMSPADADAIVAYLRTIPAIVNMIPPKNFAFPAVAVSPPVPADKIPDPTLPATDPNYASAMRGKYLAGNFGVCMECHTKHVQTPGMVPLDLDKLFAGGESFNAAAIGLPPSFPVPVIFTENITPHSTGLQGWTAAAVATLIQDGLDKDGVPICPPMPSGPGKAFNGITNSDALDIGNYITHLPAIDNVVAPICHDVIRADGGGAPDGGDGSTGDGAVPPEAGNDVTTTPDATPDATGDNAGDTGGGSDGASDGTTGDGAGDGSTGDGSTGDGSTGGDAADGSSDANPG
jgi:hypothetical protein